MLIRLSTFLSEMPVNYKESIISYLMLLVLSSGYGQNVGLGTSIPEARLHIRSTGWIKTIFENDAGQPRGYIGTDNNGTVTLAANAFWNGSSWVYPNSGSSMFMLMHRVNNQFEFRVRPDGGNQNTAMVINQFGRVGIGTTNPQQMLSVGGGMVIDQDNQNIGTTANTLRFGNNSGEAIGSRRSTGTNQHGLDFYTANTLRMTVVNNGNIGIGTSNPQGLLEIKTGADRSIKFKHDVVPTMELVSSNANDALAGIMRFRNAIEVMPNAEGTKAGKIDVRNTSGNSTIILDGSNGVISSANAAAFGLKRVFKQVSVAANGGANETLCEITVNIPAGGTLYIEGVTDCFFKYSSFWNTQGLELKLDEYASDNTYISTLIKDEYRETRDMDNRAIFATLNVPSGGIRKFRLVLFKSGNMYSIGGEFHAIKVWYFPAALQVN